MELPGSGEAKVWAELLSTSSSDTKTLLTYGPANGWLDGKPAMVSRAIGGGYLSYLGTLPDPKLLRTFLTLAAPEAPKLVYPGQDAIEVCNRDGASGPVSIYINHGPELVSVPLQHAMRNLLSSNAAPVSEVTLSPQGVAVLVPEPAK